jgi:predicted DNA-binding protein YlxM (UPF0122 family)
LYCNGDLSLAEIAENLDISRQGVYDNIKRGRAALTEFEAKLGLAEKFTEQKMKLLKIINDLKEIVTENTNYTSLNRTIKELEELKNEI